MSFSLFWLEITELPTTLLTGIVGNICTCEYVRTCLSVLRFKPLNNI